MEFRGELNKYFNKVVAWAENQEAHILANGVRLTEDQQIDAFLIGVKEIPQVRLLKVKTIPVIDDPKLLEFGKSLGLFSSRTAGVSYRYGIYIRADQWDSRRLVVHELVHTMQYERCGSFDAFLRAYIGQCVTFGYPNGPFEKEAIEVAKKICGKGN